MKLYLMRHGEAEPYQQNDSGRALTSTGRGSVASKARLIPAVDVMYVSPYLRALQSADILVDQGVSVKHRIVDDRVTPDCNLEPIIDELLRPDEPVQLIVAHNPLLSRLTRHLAGEEARGVNLATAQVACLEADEFLPGCATLLWVK
ncbi:histidine phosphatase family protein [Reinekea marina]|uniref:SixA phosphatase family protein n=1 Tax=Reinekea marina TaxID=1310421 RepID=A0ABV7WSB8_9GAMM|nr:histidine phosphatase family protein [Reinekea marina]MDN3649049.1 histidine phosphatase family protein [Reinekea marina]